ncbi:hypothetical protein HU200_047702 [Digitaria exilis]|uniref:Uncharacterized protein n=1 Tax=Digitaria exilis TaxID=1010633 RepID=A0A835AWI9_9POAL|nr:hypothetical protein HU200_047702 [Digitaria exilis]
MAGKKPRKAYTITRPRERWTADEHERFLHALVLFGRDWKRIEAFVVSKTSTQIRSHAQKHFRKAQKLGLPTPAPHPRRAAILADAVTPSHETLIQLPLSPDDLYFAQVYRRSGRAKQNCRETQTQIDTERRKPTMAAMARSFGTPAGKKPRKAYTITRPRERWTADEHERFLHALVLFGRDWKRIEAFVVSKTSTQIRSHAQKHFLKAQKLGLPAPPPQHSRRAAVLGQPPVGCSALLPGDAVMAPRDEALIQLPLSPDDLYFAQVYRFVGDIFGSDNPQPVEAQLQRLLCADPVLVDTILRVLGNLEANLFL